MTPILTNAPALEDAIRTRLEARVGTVLGVGVEACPDDPDDFSTLGENGVVLVAYRGSDFGQPQDTAYVAQDRALFFVVYVKARNLNGHDGAVVLLEATREALAGHEPPGFGKIIPRQERFIGQEGGLWTYALTVSAATVAVEVPDDEIVPVLQHVTIMHGTETTEVSNA